MSNAKKCDRCREFYTGTNHSRRYILEEDVLRNDTTPTVRHKKRDLCPDCYHGLKEWYNSND